MALGPKAFFPEQATLLNTFVLIRETRTATSFCVDPPIMTMDRPERLEPFQPAGNRLLTAVV